MNKNCTKFVFVLALFMANMSAGLGQGHEYAKQYSNECRETKNFYFKHKKLFEKAAQSVGLSPQMLFAIVAPEFTQYSSLDNKMETYSLKVFYVQQGKAYSDFSIGYFQMKPSFIELLEEYAASDANLKKKYAACLFPNPNERSARVARIDRLNTIEWQIIYLSLFCDVLHKRFENLSFDTNEEQLRFYASAYNCGFHKSEWQIKETEQKALFPHYSKQKFKYSDIALWFYLGIE